jgi:pSer/pThr/pTyr-binding forkhead associated (FHA) protein
MHKRIGFDPPVAFVVATAGPHRGEHFALRAGRSFIGRSADADVSLPSDDTVSREAHALISYDQKTNSFLIAPGQSRGLTYRDDHEVVGAEKLEAYDTIEVGKTKAVFLPLCGQHFRWE